MSSLPICRSTLRSHKLNLLRLELPKFPELYRNRTWIADDILFSLQEEEHEWQAQRGYLSMVSSRSEEHSYSDFYTCSLLLYPTLGHSRALLFGRRAFHDHGIGGGVESLVAESIG